MRTQVGSRSSLPCSNLWNYLQSQAICIHGSEIGMILSNLCKLQLVNGVPVWCLLCVCACDSDLHQQPMSKQLVQSSTVCRRPEPSRLFCTMWTVSQCCADVLHYHMRRENSEAMQSVHTRPRKAQPT